MTHCCAIVTTLYTHKPLVPRTLLTEAAWQSCTQASGESISRLASIKTAKSTVFMYALYICSMHIRHTDWVWSWMQYALLWSWMHYAYQIYWSSMNLDALCVLIEYEVGCNMHIRHTDWVWQYALLDILIEYEVGCSMHYYEVGCSMHIRYIDWVWTWMHYAYWLSMKLDASSIFYWVWSWMHYAY